VIALYFSTRLSCFFEEEVLLACDELDSDDDDDIFSFVEAKSRLDDGPTGVFVLMELPGGDTVANAYARRKKLLFLRASIIMRKSTKTTRMISTFDYCLSVYQIIIMARGKLSALLVLESCVVFVAFAAFFGAVVSDDYDDAKVLVAVEC
jgi:hypothetical protein